MHVIMQQGEAPRFDALLQHRFEMSGIIELGPGTTFECGNDNREFHA